MKHSTLTRQNGILLLLAVLIIAALIVFAVRNAPGAVVSDASRSELISLPSILTSMDVGTNAPWLGAFQVPVTGSQGNAMDAGAGALGLKRGDRNVHYTPVPTSSGVLSGGGR